MIDVEHALRDLAAHVDAPEIDVADGVRSRLLEQRRPRRWRRWIAGAVVGVAALLGIVPGTRTAIADWFGLRGVAVRYEDRSATTIPDGPLALGERVRLDVAAGRLGHPPLVAPQPPDAVHADGPVVTLTYGSLLLSQFPGGGEKPFVLKKLLPEAATIRDVFVNDGRGLWIEGPHTVDIGTPRRATSTLLWEQGPLTLRLEGAATLEEALAFAGTLRAAAV